MSRRYLPDGNLMMSALAGRIDVLEETTRQTATDVTAIGRGLGDLTAQIRRLTNSSGAGSGPPASSAGPRSAPADEAEEPQWDWFAVEDPETARLLLDAVIELVDRVLVHYGLRLAPVCWPLHPTVVADLISLMAERDSAYTGTTPTPVSEWLTRWLPAGLDRITRTLADCVAERGHRHAGRTYDLTGFDPYSVPAWWATDRTTDPVDAFALTPA